MRRACAYHSRHAPADATGGGGAKRNIGRPWYRKRGSMTASSKRVQDRKEESVRKARFERNTTETRIAINLAIEGQGRYKIATGIRFFDHMLELFTRHGAFDLDL